MAGVLVVTRPETLLEGSGFDGTTIDEDVFLAHIPHKNKFASIKQGSDIGLVAFVSKQKAEEFTQIVKAFKGRGYVPYRVRSMDRAVELARDLNIENRGKPPLTRIFLIEFFDDQRFEFSKCLPIS